MQELLYLHCTVNQQPGQWRYLAAVFQFDCCCYRLFWHQHSISVFLGFFRFWISDGEVRL